MGDIVGSESKGRLTERVLSRVGARAEVLVTQTLLFVHAEMGPDANISADAYGQMCLQSFQIALVEELVADVKDIRSTKVTD